MESLRGPGEQHLSAGIKLRARAYNAFLQGQFRDRAVTFGSSELEQSPVGKWPESVFRYEKRMVLWVWRDADKVSRRSIPDLWTSWYRSAKKKLIGYVQAS